MTIKRSIDDLPLASANEMSPTRQSILVEPIASHWFAQYKASDDFVRDRAMPELPLRASSISKRCDRALWYELTGVTKSNPPDAAAVFRMMLGQMIHAEADKAMEALPDWNVYDDDSNKHGWFVEEAIDLRPAGFPGSAHGDMILYEHGQPQIVCELKSQGGFSFKTMATNFKGKAAGPRWEHIMQAAMVAVAIGAPKIMVAYISMESVSPDLAKRMGANEFGRFTAEWVFDTADWEEAVALEAARQRRILALSTNEPPLRPERSLSVSDIPAGAIVQNPDRGNWQVVSPLTGKVTNAGTTWLCAYCDHRDTCKNDGDESTFVQMVDKEF